MKPIIMLIATLMLSGCATHRAQRTTMQQSAYAAYIAQARTYNAVRLKAAPGHAMDIRITGLGSLTLDAPLQALAQQPRDPTGTESFLAALNSLAPWAAMGTIGYANRPRRPTVVEQPAPVIIEQPASGGTTPFYVYPNP